MVCLIEFTSPHQSHPKCAKLVLECKRRAKVRTKQIPKNAGTIVHVDVINYRVPLLYEAEERSDLLCTLRCRVTWVLSLTTTGYQTPE